ncbi:MAG: diphthine--ammonia ligase [Thermosphaera sp.]
MFLNIAVLFTGGKDSVLAVHKLKDEGFNVKVLISIIPSYEYSMLYHKPHPQVLMLQAYSMGIPLETATVVDPGREEVVLDEVLSRCVRRYGLSGLASGAVLSRFQKERFEKIALKHGLEAIHPNWGVDQKNYLRRLIGYGVRFIIQSITTMGLPHSMLGRVLSAEDVEKILVLSEKYGFNPSFEGGEAETVVLDAPLFKYGLKCEGSVEERSEYEAFFNIKKCCLIPKN